MSWEGATVMKCRYLPYIIPNTIQYTLKYGDKIYVENRQEKITTDKVVIFDGI